VTSIKVRAEATPPVLQSFLDRLEGVQRRGGENQYAALCPAHPDRHPSLTVGWGDKSKVVFECKTGCAGDDVLQVLGLKWSDLEQPRRRVASYDYHDEDGELSFQAIRYEPKEFNYRRPNGSGGWIWNLTDVAPVPYHLTEIQEMIAHGDESDTIWIAEGEKDCDAIMRVYGDRHAATCNHGGTGVGWKDAHSELLAGLSDFPGKVRIVADNDDKATKPGQKHALRVHQSLLRVTGRDAEIAYAPVGKDAADAVDKFGPDDFRPVTPDELRAEIAEAAANPDSDTERAEKVADRAEVFRVDREARALLAAEGWTVPPDDGSWAEQRDAPDDPLPWLIPGLVFEGANVNVNAQAKSGKTSLVLNVAHSLLSGDALFGHFEVEALPEGRSVGWWNAELDRRQAVAWLRDLDMPRAEAFHPIHLRGSVPLPLDVVAVEEWAVAWLSERKVSVWILDPFSALFPGDENSNSEVGAWLAALDRIKRRAGVETAFLVHHASESPADDAEPSSGRLTKGRGASRLVGWADVIWSYTGRFDEPRYLSAVGRDVDLAPFGGITQAQGRMLRWNGKRSSPAEDRRHALALSAFEAVKAAADSGPLKARELQDKLPGAKPDPKRSAIAYAVELGWLTKADGPRNSVLYSLGDVNPHRLRLNFTGSENQ
jgi:hypothetical protein